LPISWGVHSADLVPALCIGRQLICDVSRKEFQVIYDRLDVCHSW
jgi:hypothetical protein